MSLENTNCTFCELPFITEVRVPHTIPTCGHCFCSNCKENLFSVIPESVICPIDGIRYRIQDNGQDPFPLNKEILELTSSSKSSNGVQKCQIHGKKLKLACLTDHQMICKHCLRDDKHMRHDARPLKYVQDLIRPKIDSLNGIKSNITIQEAEINKTLKLKKELILTLLSEQFRELRQVILKKEEQISDEIVAFFDTEFYRVKDALGPDSGFQRNMKARLNALEDIYAGVRIHDIKDTYIDVAQIYPQLTFKIVNELLEEYTTKFSQKFSSIFQQIDTALDSSLILGKINEIKFSSSYLGDESRTLFPRVKALLDPGMSPYDAQNTQINEIKLKDLDISVGEQFMTISIMKRGQPIYESSDFRDINSIYINFGGKQISEDLLLELLGVFKYLGHIEHLILDLNNSSVDDDYLQSIAGLILKPLDNIKTLIIKVKGCKVSDVSVQPLFSDILKRMRTIQSLNIDLTSTKITDNSIEAFADGPIRELRYLEKLKIQLDLTGVTERSISYLCENDLSYLKLFAVSVNKVAGITAKGFEKLTRHLIPSINALEHLELKANGTGLNDLNMCELFQSDLSGLRNLKLNLSHTKLYDQALQILGTKVLPRLETLEELNLNFAHTGITDRGAIQVFANSFPALKILNIDLSDNNISDQSLQVFGSHALRSMNCLEKFALNLNSTKVSDNSISHLFTYNFPNVRSLKLGLNYTFITDRTLETLGGLALPQMLYLEDLHLSLWSTDIVDRGVSFVIRGIMSNLKTFVLDISNTKTSDQTLDLIGDLLRCLSTLEVGLRTTWVTDNGVIGLLRGNVMRLKVLKMELNKTKVTDKMVDFFSREVYQKMDELEKLEFQVAGSGVSLQGKKFIGELERQVEELARSR